MKQIKFYILICCFLLIFSAIHSKEKADTVNTYYNEPLEVYLQDYTEGEWSSHGVTIKVITRAKPDVSNGGGFFISFDSGGTYTSLRGASPGGFYYTVNKEGTNNIKIMLKNSSGGKRYSESVRIKIDTTPPTVSIMDGAVFSADERPCIGFYDTGSGIDKAYLNGEEITDGMQIFIAGSYALTVTDKAGNIKEISFQIG